MHAFQDSGTHRDSQVWQSALDGALAAHGDEEVFAHYLHVANAFPSTSPNPYTRDYPLIDYRKLKEWATHRGWQVRPAPERSPKGEEYSPPVRFTRLPRSASRAGTGLYH